MDNIDSIDGLDFLMDNFFNDKEDFEKLFRYVYFIDNKIVRMQSNDILDNIKQNLPIPVRFSQKNGAFFKNNSTRTSSPKFNNRKDAFDKMKGNNYYSSVVGRNKILVCIDSDGNKSIKDYISKKTKHSFVSGKSTIINCMISHIWGKTDDPLFFSLLWNVVITPLPLSFILDKDAVKTYKIIDNKKHMEFIVDFKELIKAISILLNNPTELMNEKSLFNDGDVPDIKYFSWAEDLIVRGKIKFLPNHSSITN